MSHVSRVSNAQTSPNLKPIPGGFNYSRWEDSIRNDWNGTPKLTLICIAHWIEAWDTLAEKLGHPGPSAIAAHLREPEQEVRRTFSDAERYPAEGR